MRSSKKSHSDQDLELSLLGWDDPQLGVPWPLYIRVCQYVSNFRFNNDFIIRQAHLHPKVPKQGNVCESLQKWPAEIEWCAKCLEVLCGKTTVYKLESQLLAVQNIQNITLQYPLKTVLFWAITPPKSLFFWQMCQKCPKTIMFPKNCAIYFFTGQNTILIWQLSTYKKLESQQMTHPTVQ